MPIARPCIPEGAAELTPPVHNNSFSSPDSAGVSLVLGGKAKRRQQSPVGGRLATGPQLLGARPAGVRNRLGGGHGPRVFPAFRAVFEAAAGAAGC
jgi:hypothetical protein